MDRPARGSDWPDAERNAFWAFVRARMAVQRLKHADVAEALRMDRSVLSRRLSGEIRERPTEWMLDRLSEVLGLAGEERESLARLAGIGGCSAHAATAASVDASVARPTPFDETAAIDADPVVSPRTRLDRWHAVAWGAIGAACIAAVLAGWAIYRATARPTAAVVAAAAIRPGGVWIDPVGGATFTGTVHLAAQAYPTSRGDPAIGTVQFTASWQGRPGAWLVVCSLTAPSHDDVFECDWTPGSEVPAGPLQLSFDVYDRAKRPNSNLSPHGTRSVNFMR